MLFGDVSIPFSLLRSALPSSQDILLSGGEDRVQRPGAVRLEL